MSLVDKKFVIFTFVSNSLGIEHDLNNLFN